MDHILLKIVLIQPINPKYYWESFNTFLKSPPLVLGMLASLVPKDINVEIIDEQIRPFDFGSNADLYGITVNTTSAQRAYSIASILRSQGKVVVMGGPHVTLFPDEAQEFADSIVVGDGDVVWPQLIQDFKKNALQKKYSGGSQVNWAHFPCDYRKYFDRNRYRFRNSIVVSRGCIFKCRFCTSPWLGGPYRKRPIENIALELKQFSQHHLTDTVVFLDDTIFADREWFFQLSDLLGSLNLKWMAFCNLCYLTDSVLIDRAKQSGCVGLLTGVETLNSQNLFEYSKVHNMNIPLADVVNQLNRKGILVGACLIFGMEHDTRESIAKMAAFLNHVGFNFYSIGILRPYPGTPIYDQYLDEGRVDQNWWTAEERIENRHLPSGFKVHFDHHNFSRLELQSVSLDAMVQLINLRTLAKTATRLFGRIRMDLFFLLAAAYLASYYKARNIQRRHKKTCKSLSV